MGQIMQNSFSRVIVARRSLLMLVSLVVLLIAGAGTTALQLKTHYSVFFDKDDAQRVAHETLERDFTQADNIYFVVRPDNGDVFSEHTLRAIRTLTERSWQLPYAVRVDSIANYMLVSAVDDEIAAAPAIDDSFSYAMPAIEHVKALLLERPELKKVLLAEDGSMTGVNVSMALPYASETAAKEATLAARTLRDDIVSQYPELSIDVVGQVAFNWDFTELAEIDGQTLFPVMFTLMFLVMSYFYRSLAAVISTLLVISMSSAFAMGMGGWLGFTLNPINLVAGTIIMTVAVADCVHVLNEFFARMRLGDLPEIALQHSFSLNAWPITTTSLTTAIGFLGLNFSASPPFRELGNITAMGVFAAWILVYTLFPWLLLKMVKDKQVERIRSGAATTNIDRFIQTLINGCKKISNTAIVCVLLMTTALTACIALNKLDERVLMYFDKDVPFRQAVETIQDKMLGFDRIAYRFDSGDTNGVYDPHFLLSIDQFVQWARTQHEVTQVTSYTDVIKTLHQTMNDGSVDTYTLPSSRESASQLVLAYELSLPFGADSNHLVDQSKQSLRVSVGLRSQSADELLAFDKKVQTWFAGHMPANVTTSHGASVSMMFAHIGNKNIESMVYGNITISLLITLCLIVAIRSFKYGLLMLLPNITPALVTFGLWGLLVGEINMAVAVVFCISLGIVVDDTIHFTSKFLHARRNLAMSPAQAIDYAYDKVGKAMLVTSLILVCGFLVLALSPLKVNSHMGLLVAMSIFVACVFDLSIFPRILLWVETRSLASTNASTSEAIT